jgi:hypothetical protein
LSPETEMLYNRNELKDKKINVCAL